MKLVHPLLAIALMSSSVALVVVLAGRSPSWEAAPAAPDAAPATSVAPIEVVLGTRWSPVEGYHRTRTFAECLREETGRPVVVLQRSMAWVSPAADLAAAAHQADRLLGLLVSLSAGGIGAAALLGHWLTGSLVAMAARVRALGEGRPDDEFPVPEGEGEVTVLATALRSASRQLGEAREGLEANRRRMVEVEKLAAVGTLAAGVAHEVANPIAGAKACVRRLARADLDPSRRDEYASLAGEALDRASRVLRDLLAYARPGIAGTEELEVPAVMEMATRLVAGAVPCPVIVLGGPALRIRWPRRQVEQVVTNLLLNAAHAARSEVTLAWAEEGDRVLVDVADDGPGIPEELLVHVFEPFFTTRPVGEGTGLGLSVSLALARAMGGWIELRPNPAGRGTLARFVLPSHVAESADAPPDPAR